MTSRIALVHPTGLLATETREALERRPELYSELLLLSDDPAEIGTLTQVDGAAAMVADLGESSLDAVDVAMFFGGAERSRAALESLPAGVDAVLVGDDWDVGHPVVDGVNLETVRRGEPILSPSPAVVGLAHLLRPLADFAPRRVVATVLEPVSAYGKEGLDELFEQARDLLSFRGEIRREILPAQLAFNVLGPRDDSGAASLRSHLAEVLGRDDLEVSIQRLRAGLFHGLGLSVQLELARDPEADGLRDALAAHPMNEIVEDPELLGTVDVASRDEVLIGAIDSLGGGRYALWAVLDNLTRGGALNALAILEVLTGHADA